MGAYTRWSAAAVIALSATVCRAGSPQEAIAATHANVQRFPELARTTVRHFYCGHLEEEGPDGKLKANGEVKKELWQVLSAHCNSVSHKRTPYRPVVVLRGDALDLTEMDGLEMELKHWDRAVLFRIDLIWYGWDVNVWEKYQFVDPYLRYQVPSTRGLLTNVKISDKGAEVLGGDVQRVFVFRNGFKQVPVSDVQQGEEVYEEVRKGAYQRIQLPVRQQVQAPQTRGEGKQERAIWVSYELETELQKWTHSKVPVVYADFAWWQASIQAERAPGPGYNDFLGVKNEADFHRRAGFDPVLFKAQFAEFAKEYREAVRKSGVSKQPRRISGHETIGNRFGFITFDSIRAVGEKNPLDRPDDRFDFEATEQIFNGASGLYITGLFAKGGKAQDFAPVETVGGDKTTTDNDVRIHVGQCFRCHDEGLKSFKGYYKRLYRGRVQVEGPDGKAIYKLQDEYFEALEDKLEPSRRRHEETLKRVSGLTMKQYSAAITSQWKRYNSDGVKLKRAAAHWGVPAKRIQDSLRALKQQGKLQGLRVYDTYIENEDDEAIPIDQYHESAGELGIILMGGGKK